MALENLCVRDQHQTPTRPAQSVRVENVLLCQDCGDRKTAQAFAVPDLCVRCIIEQLPPVPQYLAVETPTTTINPDIASKVTAAILELLDNGKLPPWKMGFEYANPRNAISGHQYQGINRWMLLAWQILNGWTDSLWLTANQARTSGGRVKDGEIPAEIHFYLPGRMDSETGEFRVHVVATHEVYNLEQTTVILPAPFTLEPLADFSPVAEAARIIEDMPNKPRIQHHAGMDGPAHYLVLSDLINLPVPELFNSPERYYETIFHELAHSTGSPAKLNRFTESSVQNESLHDYGFEELVSEMTTAMLCEKAGIGQQTIENTAAYIQHWKEAIRADRSIVMRASHAAERALGFISA